MANQASEGTADPTYAELPIYDADTFSTGELIYENPFVGGTYVGGTGGKTITPQHIDEYTDLGNPGIFSVLTGEDVSSNLSTRYSGCIDRARFNWPIGNLTQPGWRKQQGEHTVWDFSTSPATEITVTPDQAWYTKWRDGSGISIGLLTRSQVYYDPDQGKTINVSGLHQFGHLNPAGIEGDPTLQTLAADHTDDGFGDYGSVSYENPFEYQPGEQTRLFEMFGFQSGFDSVDAMTRSFMQDATDTLIEDMMTGFIPRSDVTRRTPNLQLTDSSFEKIMGKEIAENVQIADNIGIAQSLTGQIDITDESIRASVIARATVALAMSEAGPDAITPHRGPGSGDSSGTAGAPKVGGLLGGY